MGTITPTTLKADPAGVWKARAGGAENPAADAVLKGLAHRAVATIPSGRPRSDSAAAGATTDFAKRAVASPAASPNAPPSTTPSTTPAGGSAQLVADIDAAVADGAATGAARHTPDPARPQTLTALQALLYSAVNGRTPAALRSDPALLRAVRAGFATPGGQQLAVAINMLDADIVGLMAPPIRDLTRINRPAADIVADAFSFAPGTDQATIDAFTQWVTDTKDSPQRGFVETLLERGPIAVTAGGDAPSGALVFDGVTESIVVASDASAESIAGGLRAVAENMASDALIAVEFGLAPAPAPDPLMEYGTGMQGVSSQVQAMVENSPTLRNVIQQARTSFDSIRVVVDDTLVSNAQIAPNGRQATIRVRPGSVERMASGVVFELGNAAQQARFAAVAADPYPINPQAVEKYGRQILSGLFANDPDKQFAYQRFASDPEQAGPMNRLIDRLGADLGRAPTEAEIKSALLDDRSMLDAYMAQLGPDARTAVRKAVSYERVEVDTLLLHEKIGSELLELKASGDLAGARTGLLTDAAIEAMRPYPLDAWNINGNLRQACLEVQFATGHTGTYFEGFMGGAKPGAIGVPSAADNAHASAETATESGSTARATVAEAAQIHADTNPAAVRAAADAALAAQSTTVAEQILANPQVLSALRASGKVLTVAAAAALVAQLALAVRDDVRKGDHTGGATRHALAEIIGGVAGAEVGVAAGAAAGGSLGAAAGSVIPVLGTAAGAAVGAAVGGFIGGLFGFGLGSYAAGRAEDKVQALVDGLIAEQHPAPAKGSLGNLLAEPDRNAQQFIAAGSSDDAQVNAPELRRALERFGYEGASDAELGRMIDAYSSAGNGALTAADLAAAIRDRALSVDSAGRAGVDPYRYSINLGAGDGAQAVQAGHIATRLINLSVGADGNDDRRINTDELTESLQAGGYRLAQGTNKGTLQRALSAYDRDGDAAVGQQDLTQALLDGAIVIDTDGSVSVNTSRILGQSGAQSAHIALRIVQSGSDDDLWANRSELADGLKAAGYDSRLSEDDREALIARYGLPQVAAIGVEGLQRAIDDGALVLDGDGAVRYLG